MSIDGRSLPEHGTESLKTEVVPRWRRVRRWVLLAVLLVVVLVVGYGVAVLSGWVGPAPYLSQIKQEPVLVAPIPAEELGRVERKSQYGLFGDVNAYVYVAYAVNLPEEEAYQAWFDAYPDYDFRPRMQSYWAPTSNANVTIAITDEVVVPPDLASNFRTAPPDSTIVTVRVTGR
ncbi:hypothetical protein SAMN06309944_1160 [Micrococcales bacterium KH10]|nr:hypothetical protein SAMN06309944_1160 [Micrococcales bacterium KH10]